MADSAIPALVNDSVCKVDDANYTVEGWVIRRPEMAYRIPGTNRLVPVADDAWNRGRRRRES